MRYTRLRKHWLRSAILWYRGIPRFLVSFCVVVLVFELPVLVFVLLFVLVLVFELTVWVFALSVLVFVLVLAHLNLSLTVVVGVVFVFVVSAHCFGCHLGQVINCVVLVSCTRRMLRSSPRLSLSSPLPLPPQARLRTIWREKR